MENVSAARGCQRPNKLRVLSAPPSIDAATAASHRRRTRRRTRGCNMKNCASASAGRAVAPKWSMISVMTRAARTRPGGSRAAPVILKAVPACARACAWRRSRSAGELATSRRTKPNYDGAPATSSRRRRRTAASFQVFFVVRTAAASPRTSTPAAPPSPRPRRPGASRWGPARPGSRWSRGGGETSS